MANIPDDRLFITVAEAAEILMADERTVRRGIERGDLPGIKVGSTIRIPWDKFKQVTGLGESPLSDLRQRVARGERPSVEVEIDDDDVEIPRCQPHQCGCPVGGEHWKTGP